MHVVVVPHDFQDHYSLGFANGLASRGLQVDFVRSAKMDPVLLHQNISSEDLGCNTENEISAWEKTKRFAAYHLKLINFITHRRSAIVHVIGLLRKPAITGIFEGILFRTLAAKYVLTVHNILPHDRHTIWNKWLFKTIYRIPHLLVVHTERMKDELAASFGIPKIRIVVMQHGLNDMVPDHGLTRKQCRNQLGVPEDACVLLFFGRIAPYKGVELLLEAFEKNHDSSVILIIAGAPFNPEYGNSITELVRNHPFRERIICQAIFIDNADIASYFRASDGLVMPYRHIDQSGVLFLALRFCLPIIAFDVGALREYVNENTGVLVKETSAQALAEGIQIFRHEQLRFTPNSLEEYTQRFSWGQVLEPVIQAYNRP